MIALGLWVYFSRRDFRPAIGAMGWACLVWVHYVALRYLWIILTRPESTGGSAEGIYLLPALYMTVGYVLFLYRDRLAHLVWVFMAISLAALATSVDITTVFLPDSNPDLNRLGFLFQNNTIHASVSAGIMLIGAYCFVLWLIESDELSARVKTLGVTMAVAVGLLAMLGIIGARSKGVWIALSVISPFALSVGISQTEGKTRFGLIATILATFAAGALIFGHTIWQTIGQVVDGAFDIGEQALSGRPVRQIMLDAIDTGALPYTFDERMRIWWNAMSIWRTDWLFGQGIWWENLWHQTRFADIGYELMHNGYLEIAIRFGLFGLEFYAILLVWCVYQATAATRRGLVPLELYFFYLLTMIFFLATMLSNSNIRLAVGETYMLMAGGFGFCCYYLRQAAGRAS
ncbi:O-antigen ligase family protein [Nitratireductor arenosus]|uniref:O-antigen ligase family protein n=1 Tax=Nitratireductor arenosus TaxID=2682096 RepID=UPI0018D249B9|nr:O-antigen ligase family protein [Nitratireductor arenosus]